MECSPSRSTIEEDFFGMYIHNLYCTTKGLSPFESENNKEKRKKRLNDFSCSIRKILANKKALAGEGEYFSLDEKEERLQYFCDAILDILFNRRKDLDEMKIRDHGDFLLFLEKIFGFFLSEKNLPSFLNLIFDLTIGGSIFTKKGDYEKDREWLDSFEFKI